MACACGSKGQKFIAFDKDGNTIAEYNTKVEAQAAGQRKGGGSRPK